MRLGAEIRADHQVPSLIALRIYQYRIGNQGFRSLCLFLSVSEMDDTDEPAPTRAMMLFEVCIRLTTSSIVLTLFNFLRFRSSDSTAMRSSPNNLVYQYEVSKGLRFGRKFKLLRLRVRTAALEGALPGHIQEHTRAR